MIPNLLITDDDSAFRDALCEGLSRRGFRVTAACDGEEAIDKVISHNGGARRDRRSSTCHGCTGLEVIRRLREHADPAPRAC